MEAAATASDGVAIVAIVAPGTTRAWARRHWYAVVLGVLLLLATGLRTYHLTTNPPELFEDEIIGAASIWSLATTGRDVERTYLPFLLSRQEMTEPLYPLATLPTQALLGHTTLAVRLPAVAYSLATMVLIVWVLRVLGRSPREQLIAAALFAIVPLAVHYGRVGWQPASAMVPTLAGVGLLWLGMERRSAWRTVAGAVALMAGVYAYPPGLLVNALLALTVIALHVRVLDVRRLAALAGASAVALLLLYPYVHAMLTEPLFTFRSDKLFIFSNGVTVQALQLAAHNYWEQWNPYWMFFAPIISPALQLRYHPNTPVLLGALAPCLVLGLVALGVARSRQALLLVVWMLVGALPAGLTSDGTAVPNFARGIIALPAILMVMAIGVDATARWVAARSRPTAFALGAVLTVVLGVQMFSAYTAYFVDYPRESAGVWYYGTGAGMILADQQMVTGGRLCVARGAIPFNTFWQNVRWYLHTERYTVIEGTGAPECQIPGTYILEPSGLPTRDNVLGTVTDFGGFPMLRVVVVRP